MTEAISAGGVAPKSGAVDLPADGQDTNSALTSTTVGDLPVTNVAVEETFGSTSAPK